MLDKIFSFSLWGNTGREYLMAGVIFLGVLIVLKIFQMIGVAYLQKLAKKTKNDFDDTAIEIVSKVKPPFYFLVAVFLGVKYLTLAPLVAEVVKILFVVILIWEIIRAAQKMVEYGARKMIAHKKGVEDKSAEITLKTFNVFAKVILWSLGLILMLGNLGVDVSALLAGLGIGGIAIALALQNVLGDIFASISIIIDKPFEIGDFIIIGNDMGIVEKIGIKTTRIRTLQGEELVVSNKELTSARVQNFKKMERRRVAFNLGVIYETPKEKLAEIPGLVKKIIDQIPKIEFDRCHFKSFGNYSLNFETVYYVESGDYNEYMDLNQKVNLAIFEAFGREKIEFAYPTQVEYQKRAS